MSDATETAEMEENHAQSSGKKGERRMAVWVVVVVGGGGISGRGVRRRKGENGGREGVGKRIWPQI